MRKRSCYDTKTPIGTVLFRFVLILGTIVAVGWLVVTVINL